MEYFTWTNGLSIWSRAFTRTRSEKLSRALEQGDSRRVEAFECHCWNRDMGHKRLGYPIPSLKSGGTKFCYILIAVRHFCMLKKEETHSNTWSLTIRLCLLCFMEIVQLWSKTDNYYCQRKVNCVIYTDLRFQIWVYFKKMESGHQDLCPCGNFSDGLVSELSFPLP